MARKVTVTKAERAAVEWAVGALEAQPATKAPQSHLTSLRGLLAKVDAPVVKADAGLGWTRLRDALLETLGDRLALPENPDAGWYATQNRRIKSVGLTAEGAADIARYVAGWRRPVIAFEFVTARLTDLLAGARRTDGGERPVGGGWGLDEFAPRSPFDD